MGPALLERIDRAIAELQVIRAELAATNSTNVTIAEGSAGATVPNGDNITIKPDDLSPDDLLDTHAAAERFSYPQDTIRKWCRTEGLGVMQGGRWLVSVPRLQRRINGK